MLKPDDICPAPRHGWYADNIAQLTGTPGRKIIIGHHAYEVLADGTWRETGQPRAPSLKAANAGTWPERPTIRTVMRGRWLEAIVDAAIVAGLFGAIIMLVECFG